MFSTLMVMQVYSFLLQFRDKLDERGSGPNSTMDAALQKLWHEHIRTITSSVRHLNREIDSIKDEVSNG